jgi:hypothetical protein
LQLMNICQNFVAELGENLLQKNVWVHTDTQTERQRCFSERFWRMGMEKK